MRTSPGFAEAKGLGTAKHTGSGTKLGQYQCSKPVLGDGQVIQPRTRSNGENSAGKQNEVVAIRMPAKEETKFEVLKVFTIFGVDLDSRVANLQADGCRGGVRQALAREGGKP